MKLIKSMGRELVLLSRSYYFYIEIAMSILYLVLLLLVMPENISQKSTEYYYFDMPKTQYEQLESKLFPNDASIKKEGITLKKRGQQIEAVHYETDMKDVYVVDSESVLKELCEDSGDIGLMVSLDGSSLSYKYYLQGYETETYKNLAALVSSADVMEMVSTAEKQDIKLLAVDARILTDRQNLLSILLPVNCVLIGILIMAAYIFEDKKSNMINAIRVTPTSVNNYLFSKIGTILLTSILSTLIVTIPIMRGTANYLLLATVILSAEFLIISLGSLIASFFKDMESAFAAVFIALIVLIVPAIANMLPTWNPLWLKLIPSYWIIEGTQNALLQTSTGETLIYCAVFLMGGGLVYFLSLYRYQHKEASGI